MTSPTPTAESGIAVVLLVRSAFAAPPRAEMEAFARETEGRHPALRIVVAYVEQGEPSLKARLGELRDAGYREIRLVPLLVPVEPSLRVWLRRSLARWRLETGTQGPRVRLGRGAIGCPAALAAFLDALLADAAAGEDLDGPQRVATEGSLVPAQKYRVLVCAGAACNDAGSSTIWNHLRNEQERLGLRSAGAGTMTARTTCLGPCALAPVVQVWPDGTNYGAVDEAALDRIVEEHLLAGREVTEYAYRATGRKQRPRPRPR